MRFAILALTVLLIVLSWGHPDLFALAFGNKVEKRLDLLSQNGSLSNNISIKFNNQTEKDIKYEVKPKSVTEEPEGTIPKSQSREVKLKVFTDKKVQIDLGDSNDKYKIDLNSANLWVAEIYERDSSGSNRKEGVGILIEKVKPSVNPHR